MSQGHGDTEGGGERQLLERGTSWLLSLCTEQKGEQDPSMIRVRVRGTGQRPASHYSLELERIVPVGGPVTVV